MFWAWITWGAPKASWFRALPVHKFSIASFTIPAVKKAELEGQGTNGSGKGSSYGTLYKVVLYIHRGEGGDGNCFIISCHISLEFRLIQNWCISFSNWDRNTFFCLPMRWQKMCDKSCIVRPRATSLWGQALVSHRLISLIDVSSFLSPFLSFNTPHQNLKIHRHSFIISQSRSSQICNKRIALGKKMPLIREIPKPI